MTFKEMLRFTYGIVMGTSTPYLKPSKRFLFPTATVTIDENLSLFMGGSGSCGILQKGPERLIINTNRGVASHKLKELLDDRAKDGESIKREVVVLNSVIQDYAGGLSIIGEAASIVVGSVDERKLVRQIGEASRRAESIASIARETILEIAGETVILLPVGPAASQSDLVVFLQNHSMLFLGPLFFNGIHPVFHARDGMNIVRWIQEVESLLMRFQPKTIVPGEGDTGSIKDVEEFLNYLRALSDSHVEFSHCRKNFDWIEIPGHTSLEENFDLLRAHRKAHTN